MGSDAASVRVIGLTAASPAARARSRRCCASCGAPVVDADLLARQVVEPGQPALAEIVARFGADVLDRDGQLDRKTLGEHRVRRPPMHARALEAITHPRIAAASQQEIARLRPARAPGRVLRGGAARREPPHPRPRRAHRGVGPDASAARAACRPRRHRPRPPPKRGSPRSYRSPTSVAAADLGDRQRRHDRRSTRRAASRELIGEDESARDRGRRSRTPTRRLDESVLITGFPAFTARRMVAQDPRRRRQRSGVRARARASSRSEAAELIALLPEDQAARVEPIVGDVCDMDLGLSGSEYPRWQPR